MGFVFYILQTRQLLIVCLEMSSFDGGWGGGERENITDCLKNFYHNKWTLMKNILNKICSRTWKTRRLIFFSFFFCIVIILLGNEKRITLLQRTAVLLEVHISYEMRSVFMMSFPSPRRGGPIGAILSAKSTGITSSPVCLRGHVSPWLAAGKTRRSLIGPLARL